MSCAQLRGIGVRMALARRAARSWKWCARRPLVLAGLDRQRAGAWYLSDGQDVSVQARANDPRAVVARVVALMLAALVASAILHGGGAVNSMVCAAG